MKAILRRGRTVRRVDLPWHRRDRLTRRCDHDRPRPTVAQRRRSGGTRDKEFDLLAHFARHQGIVLSSS
ncbi:MAG: hypothetical protein R2713_12095 [Ilumatobacteraceae bacterium]